MDPRAAERQASLCDATSGSEAVARVERVYIITCHRRRRRCVLLIAVRRRASTAAAVIFNNGRNFYRPLSDHNLLPELFDDETMKRRAKSVPRASSSNSSVLCRAIRRERRGVVGGGRPCSSDGAMLSTGESLIYCDGGGWRWMRGEFPHNREERTSERDPASVR